MKVEEEKKVLKACFLCGKKFQPIYNAIARTKVCTPASHKCRRQIEERPDGRRRVIQCTTKCCRSKYRKSAASVAMDQTIDPRKLLTKKEFETVIDASRKVPNPSGIAIRFIAATGCRVGESLLVRPEDFRPEGAIPGIRVPTLKRGGRPVRTIDLYDKEFVRELSAWVKKASPGEPLFQCCKRTIQMHFENILERLEISKDSNIHVLRHTRASQLAAAGAQLNYIRQQMGWSSIAMVQIYVHTSEEERRQYGKKLPTL